MQVQCLQTTSNHSFLPQTKTLTISPQQPHFTLQNQPVPIQKPIKIHQIQNLTYLDLNSKVSIALHTIHIHQLVQILKQFKIHSIKVPTQETQRQVQNYPISRGGTVISGTYDFQHDCYAGIEQGKVWVRNLSGQLLIEKQTDSVYFSQEFNSFVFGNSMFFIWKRVFDPTQFNISLFDSKAMELNFKLPQNNALPIKMDTKEAMSDQYEQVQQNMEAQQIQEEESSKNRSEGQSLPQKHEKMQQQSSLSVNNSNLQQSTPTKPMKQIHVQQSSMEDNYEIPNDHCNVNENDENCFSKCNLFQNECHTKTQKKIRAIPTDNSNIQTSKKIYEMQMQLDITTTKLSKGSITELTEKTHIKKINFDQVQNQHNKILARCPIGSDIIDVRIKNDQTYLHLNKFENNLTESQKLTQLYGKSTQSTYSIEPTVLLYSPSTSNIFLNDPQAYNLFTYNITTNKIHQLPTHLPIIHMCHQSNSTILGIHKNQTFIFDIRQQTKHRLFRYKTVANFQKIYANGDSYVTRDFDGVVRTYDIRSNKKGLNRFNLQKSKSTNNLEISNDGSYIISGNELIKCVNEDNCSILSSTIPHSQRNQVTDISSYSLSHAQFIHGLPNTQIIGVYDNPKTQRAQANYLVKIDLETKRQKRVEIQKGHIDYLECDRQWIVYGSQGNYFRHRTDALF